MDRPARVFTLREGSEHLVGRDAECAAPADDDRVSRRHARLRFAVHSCGRVRVDLNFVVPSEEAPQRLRAWPAEEGTDP